MTDSGSSSLPSEVAGQIVARLPPFLTRWEPADGRERANYQLFLTELAELLGLPKPDPAGSDERDNAYVFERKVVFQYGDGSTSNGYIDLYRRGAFVLEAKDVKETADPRYDDAMLRARSQAEAYARALPSAEGRPPFLLVVDVGRTLEVYAEFSRSGATYTPFPDPRSHRLRVADLGRPEVADRLRRIWLDPLSLDPTRQAARVTREIAAHLAELARGLEAAGHDPENVARFLTCCLFSLFAEDIGLLPKQAFTGLLDSLDRDPRNFVPLVGELWRTMKSGGFSLALRTDLLRFNGKLFDNPPVLPVDRDQLGELLAAARADWQYVEPAIFGTLLERALDPRERHALGAHYTPRAYVERLVLPTVVEPLREDWTTARAAARTLLAEGNAKGARETIRAFHRQLCAVRVLDPACGSGNFLYVTLEHMKRLEGEVLNELEDLGDSQGLLEVAGITVDPHQLLGIEVNPRAAAVAELVLWIGYLQWHRRTRGSAQPPEPVLRDFRNIEQRDAVLAWDAVDFVKDDQGQIVTRWDGRTTKRHQVTGEAVPDEAARVPVEHYRNPRQASWPTADFVVGNPPFIGNKRMREALGDGYVEALRGAWPEIPESADFVMFWWHHAAELTRGGSLRQFGLITTNSLRQAFNRRVVERHLGETKKPLSLVFAIPDHPWVDAKDGAAVRIAMTVGAEGAREGLLREVTRETETDEGEIAVELRTQAGRIFAELRVGANLSSARPLLANRGLCGQGIWVVGDGFYVDPEHIEEFGGPAGPGVSRIVNARDLLGGRLDGRPIIDFFNLGMSEARSLNPPAFQQVADRVKPLRDVNARKSIRELWWRFAWERPVLRLALKGLQRYFVTLKTGKHRFFVALEPDVIWDGALFAVASDDWYVAGVLSSDPHVRWAWVAGGRIGVGNDPTYTNSTTFEPFPFADPAPLIRARIAGLAQQIDAHRKHQQGEHPLLTITDLYNVLEKLRAGDDLSARDRAVHDLGLVSILRQLHDELDQAVFEAYGWGDLLPLLAVVHGHVAPGAGNTPDTYYEARRALDEAMLTRLVALNAERSAEEAGGLIRWLRPDFQNPQGASPATQTTLSVETSGEDVVASGISAPRTPWPADLTDQVKAVAEVVASSRAALSEDEIAARFVGRGPWRRRLPRLLDMLVALGRARVDGGRYVGI